MMNAFDCINVVVAREHIFLFDSMQIKKYPSYIFYKSIRTCCGRGVRIIRDSRKFGVEIEVLDFSSRMIKGWFKAVHDIQPGHGEIVFTPGPLLNMPPLELSSRFKDHCSELIMLMSCCTCNDVSLVIMSFYLQVS